MALSAALLGAVGGALLFAPLDTAPWLALGSARDNEATLQLLGSALFAFAMMDWQGRSAIYGGIYGRPIAMGNLFVAVFLALGLGQAQLARPLPSPVPTAPGWIVSVLFVGLAVAFGGVLFNRPWIRTEAP
jgi:hypothetical protein